MLENKSDRAIGFSAVNLEVATIGIFVILIFAVLHWAAYFFAPLLSAIVIGLLVGRVENRLELRGMRPDVAAAILTIASMLALGFVLFGLVQPLRSWFERLPVLWTELNYFLRELEAPLRDLADLRDGIRQALGPEEAVIVAEAKREDVVASNVPALIGQMLIFIGAFYFFLAGRREIKRWLVGLYPRLTDRIRIARMINQAEYTVSYYLATVTLINLGFGTLIGVVMAVWGLPEPYLWGALAFALNFVPYAGPAIMSVLLFGASMINFPGLSVPLMVTGSYVLLNLLEGQFVTPSIIGRTATANSFLIFCSLAFGLWFWGAIGAFLAVPILLICRDVAQHSRAPAASRLHPFGPHYRPGARGRLPSTASMP